jgi:hypothetical protein
MIRNDSNEDIGRLKSELDFLKEVNQNLIHENKFLKGENYRLKRYIDRIKNQPNVNSVTSMPQIHTFSKSERTMGDFSLEETTELKMTAQDIPSLPPVTGLSRTATQISDSIDALENKNFILSGNKSLTKQYQIFEEIALYGLSEASNYK